MKLGGAFKYKGQLARTPLLFDPRFGVRAERNKVSHGSKELKHVAVELVQAVEVLFFKGAFHQTALVVEVQNELINQVESPFFFPRVEQRSSLHRPTES